MRYSPSSPLCALACDAAQWRWQALLHGLILFAPIAVLPIHLIPGWNPPTDGSPALWLVLMLSVAVGLPFFVVSTTSPLIQHWFSRTGHPHARDPYFLYRASNLGSALGLLSYPALSAASGVGEVQYPTFMDRAFRGSFHSDG